MWRIRWAPNNASKWQMGFNLVFKGLTQYLLCNGLTEAPLYRSFHNCTLSCIQSIVLCCLLVTFTSSRGMHRVYLKCLNKLQKWVPHTKTRKEFVSLYVCKHFLSAVPPHSPNLSPLDFHLWGHFKPKCIQLQFKMKRHLTNSFLMPVKPLATTPGPWEVCPSFVKDSV
jgi:hypothetical protein